MGQIARQFANGFRDILLGMRKDDIGKNDIDAPIDFGEVNPLFKTTVSSEGEDRLIKEGQILDPYTAEDRMRYPIAEGFPVKDEYNFDSNFEPRFYSGSKSEILTQEEVLEDPRGLTYNFHRFEPKGNNPHFLPAVHNPRTDPYRGKLPFSSGEYEATSTELMPFYSTIESSLRSLNIKNTGMLGKQIKQKLSKIKKYNEEEAAFIGFNLDDNITYTNRDLNKLLEDKGIIVTANIKNYSTDASAKKLAGVDMIGFRDWSYGDAQKQKLDDILPKLTGIKEEDVFEITLNVNPVFVKGSDTYEGRANYIKDNITMGHRLNEEVGPSLAHVRGNTYKIGSTKKAMLLWELQTDAMRDLKGPNARGYRGISKKPNEEDLNDELDRVNYGERSRWSDDDARSIPDSELLSDALMLNARPDRRGESPRSRNRKFSLTYNRFMERVGPEEQASVDTRTRLLAFRPRYGKYKDLERSEIAFLLNDSPKDRVAYEYQYLLEQNWNFEVGLSGPPGTTRMDPRISGPQSKSLDLEDQLRGYGDDPLSNYGDRTRETGGGVRTRSEGILGISDKVLKEKLDRVNTFLDNAKPTFAKDIKYSNGATLYKKGDQVTQEKLDKIVDKKVTEDIDISFFKKQNYIPDDVSRMAKKLITNMNEASDYPAIYLERLSDKKLFANHKREIKTISLAPIKNQRQGPLDKRKLSKQTIVKEPEFVERKLPMPTGRYSAPERYTEKLLQALIVHAKQEGIDTIYIPSPFDIGRVRPASFMESSTLTDTYITGIDRSLKNITKEEPKIKVKRTQRENPFKGKREEWENDEDIDVDFGDYLFDEDVNEGDTVDDILRRQGYFNDGGPLDEDFIPNVENADDLAAAGIFQDADRETVDLATGNVTRIGQYKPGPEEKIWDASKPRFKEMITIDIKGLKLVNIEGLKGRYAKGGLVTAPSNGLMSR